MKKKFCFDRNLKFSGLIKLLRVMKLTVFLLMVTVAGVFANKSYSQTKMINLNMRNATVKEVLNSIEEQSEFSFLYSENIIDINREVSVNIKNQKIDQILNELFEGTNVEYVIKDRFIVLTDFKIGDDVIAALEQNTISGTVTDESGQPLPGVTVVVKGTTQGTITDAEGNYSLSNVPENAILVFSFVGMRTHEIPIEGKSLINVVLAEDTIGIEEVVAVGYGTQKKINLTGSVDVVSGEKLANRPAANVSLLIQGTAPNLNINLTNRGGEPGAAASWNIRGLGSINGNDAPLILVDGVEMDVNNLDPETIESVSVLKDASASAIYGARAPFGVVLITTKKGKKGKGFSLQYNNNLASASPIKLPHLQDSYTYVTAFNQAIANAGKAQKFSDEQVERVKNYLDGTYPYEYDPDNPPNTVFAGRHMGNANYDWPHILFKNNAFTQKHNLNASGQTENTQYYISGGFYDQEGMLNWANDSYKRYNVLGNLTSQVTNWLSFDFSTKFAREETDWILGHRVNNRENFLDFMLITYPTQPYYNTNGTIQMPLIKLLQDGGREKAKKHDLWLTFGAELEPIKGWETRLSYNYNHMAREHTETPKPVYVEEGDGGIGNIGKNSYGYEVQLSQSNYALFNAVSSYEKTIDGHYFKILSGYEQEEKYYTSLYGTGDQLITPVVPSISTSLGTTTVDDALYHWATQGIFGRLNYNYKEKYLLEFSARYNGSSRFAKDSRWGFFPSVSAGYNISKENFWAAVEPYINILKIRGSYGSLGNQNVTNYLYLASVPVHSQLDHLIDGERPNYANTPGLISSDLTWETITTLDVGIDAGFLNNRLGLVADWYERITTNMFGPSLSLPDVLGTSAPFSNNAELSTKGFEIVLSWKDRISSDFSYNVKFTLGDNKSTILKYKNDEGLIDTWYEGKEVGEIWGLTSDGLIQSAEEEMPDQSYYYKKWGPGDMKYMDLTDDGIIDPGTRTLDDHGDLSVIGNSSPRYNVGITSGFNWKGIDFNMFWQGVGKRDFYPNGYDILFWGLWEAANNNTSGLMKDSPCIDYWRPADETNFLGPNTDAYLPKPYSSKETRKNRQTQTRYLLNAAYLRLKNLQVGYTIPNRISNKVFLQKARIYISGENLLLLTNLPGVYDPETMFASSYAYGGGFKKVTTGAIYPLSRTFSIGINLTF